MEMPAEPRRMAEKRWVTWIHEDGSRVMDLEFYYPGTGETQPIAAVYGLSPEAVAKGVLAQKAERGAVRMRDYINTLVEPMNLSSRGEGVTYN
jgi:hypothetical protein